MRYDKAMAEFLKDRKALGLAPNTVLGDRLALRLFAQVLPAAIEVGDIDDDHLDAWMRSMSHLMPSSKRVYQGSLSMFFKWTIRRRFRADNPMDSVDRPRLPRGGKDKGLSEEQVDSLFLACRNIREELIVSFMVMEGLRVSEVCSLERSDLDLREGIVQVVDSKMGHSREVALTGDTKRRIVQYDGDFPPPGAARHVIRQHPDHIHADPRKGLTAHYVSKMVVRIFRDAGLKGGARDGRSAHALRHTCLTDIYAATKDVRLVQAIAGHESLMTTQIYLAKVTPKDMQEAMNSRSFGTKRSPRAAAS